MMFERIIQLLRALVLNCKSNVHLNSVWNTRLGSGCRFGGVGEIVCRGVELLNNSTVISGTKNARIEIGHNVFINRNVISLVGKKITIGADTVIGPNVVLYDHDHRYDSHGRVKENASNPYKEGEIIIGKNVWLGAGAMILRGTVIGDNSIVAAGAVVKGVIPNGVLVRRENNNIIEQLENNVFK